MDDRKIGRRVPGVVFALIILPVFVAMYVACTPKKKDVGTLVIGYEPAACATLAMLAVDQGYYEAEGLKVDLVPFTSSADGLAALAAKKLDVGLSFGTGGPLTVATKGADIVIIGGNQTGGHPVLTKTENAAQYMDINAFRGKTVGSPRLFTADVVWRGALYRAGLVPGRDLEIIEFKRPIDVLEAVQSGKVDAGIGSTMITARAVEDPGIAIPLFSNDFVPNHPCCRIVVRSDTLKDKRPALVALLKAHIKAEKKFTEDPEAGVAAQIKHHGWTEEHTRDTILEPHVKYYVDPNTNGVVDMWNFMLETRYLEPQTLDPRSLIDTSIYIDALSQLKKEDSSPFWDELAMRYKEWNE